MRRIRVVMSLNFFLTGFGKCDGALGVSWISEQPAKSLLDALLLLLVLLLLLPLVRMMMMVVMENLTGPHTSCELR